MQRVRWLARICCWGVGNEFAAAASRSKTPSQEPTPNITLLLTALATTSDPILYHDLHSYCWRPVVVAEDVGPMVASTAVNDVFVGSRLRSSGWSRGAAVFDNSTPVAEK